MRLFVLAALAVAMTASSVNASILGSFIRKGLPGSPIINTIEDNNAEYIIKGAGNLDLTRFEVGDSVALYLGMESISSSDGFFAGTPLNAAIPPAGGAGYNLLGKGLFTVSSIGPIVAGKATFDFTGSVEFKENKVGLAYDFTTGIAATDAVFMSGSNSSVFTIGTVKATDFIKAVAAPVFFGAIPTFGTAVVADFGLTAIVPGDLGIVPDLLPGFSAGGATGTLHDVVGSVDTFALLSPANVLGDDKFDLRTNTVFNMGNIVPEPSSLAVFFGLAACGLGLRRRKVN